MSQGLWCLNTPVTPIDFISIHGKIIVYASLSSDIDSLDIISHSLKMSNFCNPGIHCIQKVLYCKLLRHSFYKYHISNFLSIKLFREAFKILVSQSHHARTANFSFYNNVISSTFYIFPISISDTEISPLHWVTALSEQKLPLWSQTQASSQLPRPVCPQPKPPFPRYLLVGCVQVGLLFGGIELFRNPTFYEELSNLRRVHGSFAKCLAEVKGWMK